MIFYHISGNSTNFTDYKPKKTLGESSSESAASVGRRLQNRIFGENGGHFRVF